MTERNHGDSLVFLEGLADQPVTRARAIKLLGATIVGGALMAILPDEADARKKKRRRRKRRRAKVAPSSSTPIPLTVAPGGTVVSPSINITNPSPDRPLTISEVKVIDSDGSVIATQPLVGGPVTLAPGQTAPVTVDLRGLSVTDLLAADGFRLIDVGDVPITVIDENGVQVGDIPLDVSALVDAL